MNPAIMIAMKVLAYLFENGDQVKGLILTAEKLLPDNNAKAAAVRQFIGAAIGVGDEVETAWPLFKGFFNGFVATVKTAPATAAQIAAQAATHQAAV